MTEDLRKRWGVGEWLENWEARCAEKGIALAAESVKANNAPDDEAIGACKKLGAALACPEERRYSGADVYG